jgi:hypothetical protein
MSSRSFGVAAVLAVVLALPAPAGAKGDVVARVLTPIPRDAAPGTTVSVAWTLTVVEAGKRRPFRAGYVFVRLVGLNGVRTPLAYGVEAGRPGGRYRARVRVPRGGVRRVEIGIMGTVCDGDGCRPKPRLFRIAGPVFR